MLRKPLVWLMLCGVVFLLFGSVSATAIPVTHPPSPHVNVAQARCFEEAVRFSVATDVCEGLGRPDWDAFNATHGWTPQPNDCWSWTDQYGFLVVCPNGMVTVP